MPREPPPLLVSFVRLWWAQHGGQWGPAGMCPRQFGGVVNCASFVSAVGPAARQLGG